MAYLQNANHLQIAKETNLTRWQVARLLADARELGLVRIEIQPKGNRLPEAEAVLIQQSRLHDAVVVPYIESDDAANLEGVAKAAAEYLTATFSSGDTIGLSWGATMSSVAYWLPQGWTQNVTAVGINGTVNLSTQESRTNQVVETFARKGLGRAIPLPVPAVVGEPYTREVLEGDRIVQDVLMRARSADVLCFSFGVASTDSVLINSGNITLEEMRLLEQHGAVGDVLARFIDERASVVDAHLDSRTVGLGLDDLRNAKRTIGICCGKRKHLVAKAAVRNGLVNTLVTDADTADFIVNS